jgi:hypothetical protein
MYHIEMWELKFVGVNLLPVVKFQIVPIGDFSFSFYLFLQILLGSVPVKVHNFYLTCA